MHLRPLQAADIPYLSILSANCFADDELYQILSPRSRTFPDDYREFFLLRTKQRFYDRGLQGFVCVSDSQDRDWLPEALASPDAYTPFGQLGSEATVPDRDGETLLGFAFWHRQGRYDDTTVRVWNKTNSDLLSKLNHSLLGWEQWYNDKIGADRCVDVAALKAFQKATAETYGTFDPLYSENFGAPGSWQLRIIATSPIARRRGAGRKLLEWGTDRAREEHVPATLFASKLGFLLYAAAGFRVIDWSKMEAAGACMIWDPDGIWTRAVKDGDESKVISRGDRTYEVDVVWRDRLKSE